MNGPPPPYEEVAPENANLLQPPSALVVHLQVWHYSSGGRSPADNDEFADLFRNYDLQDWEVIPLQLDGATGLSALDKYVPVEVRFRHRTWAYNDPGEHPIADVRKLFSKVVPQFVYQFFIRINSTPHHLSVFPVGVPEEFCQLYTHVYVLNRLNITVNAFFVPGPVETNDVQSWLRDAGDATVDVLQILSAIVSLYLMYHQVRGEVNLNALPGLQNGPQLRHALNVDVPQRLGELRALFQQFSSQGNAPPAAGQAVPITDVQVALDGAAGPWRQFLRLTNRMESRLVKLENNETLSNQDLYELVQDGHNAALHFSSLKKAARPLVKLLEDNYSTMIQGYSSSRTKWATTGGVGGAAAVALVVFFCWWNPAGWAAAGVAAAGLGGAGAGGAAACGVGTAAVGAVGGGVAHYCIDTERAKAFSKKDAVREFDIAIKDLDKCANQSREAVAMVFCAQVMQKRLDDKLPEHDRRTILATLGVDVDAVSNPVYNQELIRDRVRQYVALKRSLVGSMDRVLKDANFEVETSEQVG
ncbi:hypothetical protein VCV18_000833 [Metarhizium anisopliae]